MSKSCAGRFLNGVYAVVNLPGDEKKRSSRNRAPAAEYGLGATHPDEEMGIIKAALDKIRADVAPWNVRFREIPEVDGTQKVAA